MSYDIHMYNSLNEGDPKKSYQTLRDMIRRHIERQTEDRPAPNDPKKPKTKPSGAAGETEEATPVKPTPNPKRHPEDKKGKGKGDGKDRGRSTSLDKKRIICQR